MAYMDTKTRLFLIYVDNITYLQLRRAGAAKVNPLHHSFDYHMEKQISS